MRKQGFSKSVLFPTWFLIFCWVFLCCRIFWGIYFRICLFLLLLYFYVRRSKFWIECFGKEGFSARKQGLASVLHISYFSAWFLILLDIFLRCCSSWGTLFKIYFSHNFHNFSFHCLYRVIWRDWYYICRYYVLTKRVCRSILIQNESWSFIFSDL